MKRSDFKVGHFKVGDIGSTTAFVTLDGKEVDRVTECHDEEGWLVRSLLRDEEFNEAATNKTVETRGPRFERLDGLVEVSWR